VIVIADKMEDLKKQRICKKFNSDLEKPISEIYEMLQKTFLMILYVGQKPLNGSHMSKFAKIQLRIWNVQVTNCEVGEVKMWKKCISSSMRLVRPIVQCMLMHFNCRFKREADCWKICALPAE